MLAVIWEFTFYTRAIVGVSTKVYITEHVIRTLLRLLER